METPVTNEDIRKLEVAYVTERSKGTEPSQYAYKLPFATLLVRSDQTAYVQRGLELFRELRREQPEDEDQHLYYLAYGNYKLRHIDTLLKSEGSNSQALALKDIIDQSVKRDAMKAAVMVGAGLALVSAAYLGIRYVRK